jgi:phage terminase small subunit
MANEDANDAVIEDDNLNRKQRIFVREYLVDLNATNAAIRCGYSAASAHVTGSRLLNDHKIKTAIATAMEARAERTEINADWVLKRLANEADADLADLYADDGSLLPVDEWPLIWRQGLVAGIDVEEIFADGENGKERVGFVRKVRLSDRVKRLEMIGKHIAVNAFQDTIEVKGLDTLAARLERAHRRATAESEGEE